MAEYVPWLRENLLVVLSLGMTILFIYHYVVEKEHGIKLSRKYRDSLNEVLSKVFLNAIQYLIQGKKELAIKEFQSALDINKDFIDTYFALGRLFRSNGEIEKAINIHRSIIARENITESIRLSALRELAIDFDKGGFVDKAIETYKDVLSINRDQSEIIEALCNIFENIQDWEQAYYYRMMLSKLGVENQSETISQILVEKANRLFEKQNIEGCKEDLEDAFRFAPSLSAQILRLKIYLLNSEEAQAKDLLKEIIHENPDFTATLFLSLSETTHLKKDSYAQSLSALKVYFLNMEEEELLKNQSILLARIRILKENSNKQAALEQIRNIIQDGNSAGRNKISEMLMTEYVKLLIDCDLKEDALQESRNLLENFHSGQSKHFCSHCGFNSDQIFWRCPQCHKWKTIQFRWKV